MAKQSMVQSVQAMNVPNSVKRLLVDLFTALRESIAPINTALFGSVVWDPASVAAGGNANTTINVTGAALGDLVIVSFSNTLNALTLTGYVSSAGVVTVVLGNFTGGAVDLPSGTLRALVFPAAAASTGKLANFGA